MAFSHAVPDVQALLATRAASCDPLVIHWPEGIAAQGRGAPPVPPLDRHRPDDPRRAAASRCPTVVQRRRAVRRCPACRCATRSTPPTRRRRRRRQYYEMLGHARHLAQGLEGGGGARPDQSAWATSTRTAGSCSTPTRTAPRRTTSPSRAPREGARSSSRPWFDEAKENNVLPLDDRTAFELDHAGGPQWRCRRATRYTYYPGTTEVPRASAANTAAVSYKILAEVELTPDSAGRDLRAGLALRRAHAVHQGQAAVLRLQLPRHPARAAR